METQAHQQILDYIEVLFKRKQLFLIPFVSVLALAAAAYPFLPKLYSASTMVLINDNKMINPLIEGLAVKQNPEKRLKSLTTQIVNWSNLADLMRSVGISDQIQDPREFDAVIGRLKNRITIRLVTEDIVEISCDDSNPDIAMRMANAIATNLTDRIKTEKRNESANAIDFIGEQLRVYGNKLQDSEKTFFLNKVNSELDEALKRQRLLRDQLSQVERTVVTEVTREQNPLIVEYRRELAQGESLLRQMQQNTKGDNPMVSELKHKVDMLRQRVKIEEESQVSKETSAANPEYQEIASQLKELELQVNSLERRRSDLITGKMNLRSVSEQELMAMERDKKVNEDIYQSLLRRLENAHISQRLGDENQGAFRVLEPARLPHRPSKPNPLKMLLGSVAAAIAAGLGVVFLREYFDSSFRSVDDAKRFLKMPMLAYVPKILTRQEAEKLKIQDFNASQGVSQEIRGLVDRWRKRPRMQLTYIAKTIRHDDISPFVVAFHDPESVPAEQYRLMRTHLLFLNNKRSLQTIMVASTLESEGKTTTSTNLAVSMAQELNRRVLLIDCDLRKGGVARALSLEKAKGLSEYLQGECEMEALFQTSKVEGLTVITSGKIIQNPTKLIGSDRMNALMSALRERFDFIVMDAPPVLNLADVPVLLPHADGTIMVVQVGRTRRELVSSAEASLKQTHRANILGYVLTQVENYVPAYIYQYIVGGQ